MKRLSVTSFIFSALMLPLVAQADIFSDISSAFKKALKKENSTALVLSAEGKLPVRSFVLDTKGYTFDQSVDHLKGNAKPTFTEVDAGKSWRVKHEKKSSSRASCNPPVFNLSFEKDRTLFDGMTTYGDRGSLLYQKLRFVPDCDVLKNERKLVPLETPEVLLREYVIYSIFRKFGVPTPDVVAFAKIKFVTPDQNIDPQKEYKYMLLQRTSEKDDQIPFTTQFNFSSIVEAVPATEYYKIDKDGDRFSKVSIKKNNVPAQMELDAEAAIRYFLLSDLVNLYDHFLFWNEDYAQDRSSSKWKTVSFDHDFSFTCTFPPIPSVSSVIKKLPGGKQYDYFVIYDKVAREIFDNPNSLSEMLAIVDRFPFEGDKEKVKNYLKQAFYNFALYFSSAEFAKEAGLSHIPFKNQAQYLNAADGVLSAKGLSDKCDEVQVKTLKNQLTTLSAKPSDAGAKKEVTSQGAAEVSPTYAITFSPGYAPFGAKVTLYWRGAATDLDTLVTFKGKLHQFTLKGRSVDGSSLSLTLPSLSDAYAGNYEVTASNSRFGASGAKVFTVLASAAPTLKVSCSPSSLSAYTNSGVTWKASATGGDGQYSYSWSGSDSLSGTASTVTKTYSTSGTKSGSVTVVSGNQTATESCGYVSVTAAAAAAEKSYTYTPSADLKANSSDNATVAYDSSVTLSWSSTNAATCRNSWDGGSSTSGTYVTPKLTSTKTYTLTCYGASSSSQSSDYVTVTVGAPPVQQTVQTQAPAPQAPVISSISPSSGNAGTSVTISGSNFSSSGNVVYLKGNTGTHTLSPSSQNSSSITFVIPSYASGSYTITIENNNLLSSNALNFNVTTAAPVTSPGSQSGQDNVGTGTPNLLSSSLTVTGSASPSGALYAGSMTVSGAIANSGTAKAPASTAMLKYSTDGANFHDWVPVSIPEINQGGSHSYSHTWEGGVGTWYVKVCADSSGSISETNESDNCSGGTKFEVVAKTGRATFGKMVGSVMEAFKSLFR